MYRSSVRPPGLAFYLVVNLLCRLPLLRTVVLTPGVNPGPDIPSGPASGAGGRERYLPTEVLTAGWQATAWQGVYALCPSGEAAMGCFNGFLTTRGGMARRTAL